MSAPGSRPPLHPPTAEGWDPADYPAFTESLGPVYRELHEAVLEASRGRTVRRILDLGAGTGQAALALLSVHGDAEVVALDANQQMLEAAAAVLPPGRTKLVRARMQAPLPAGPFDLVVSVLAVHHLTSADKADLFARISEVLTPGGRFVLGDSVLDPQAPAASRSRLQRLRRSLRDDGVAATAAKVLRWAGRELLGRGPETEHTDLLSDQLDWLRDAGLHAEAFWQKDFCAVLRAEKPAVRERLTG